MGDPTILGWITTACYFVAAFLSVRAARTSGDGDEAITQRRLRLFWCVAALLLILLGVNKQLDLQTLLSEVGRRFVRAHGWYHSKREIQTWFVLSLAALGPACALALGLLMRRALARVWLAVAGVVFLVCFVVLGAASVHRVDDFLAWRIGVVTLAHGLELAGVICIGASAGLNAATGRRPAAPES